MTNCIRRLCVSACLAWFIAAGWGCAGQDAGAKLHALLDESWEAGLRENPLEASGVGDRRFDDRLPDVGLAFIEREAARLRAELRKLAEVDRSALSEQDRISHEIFQRLAEDRLAEIGFGSHLIPITNRSGFHIYFPNLAESMPMKEARQVENYIARLRGFRKYAQGHMELMREGMKRGMVLPAAVLEGYEKSLEPHLNPDPEKSLLYRPLEKLPATIPAADRARLQEAARRAIAESVLVGYTEFARFMKEQYVPAARSTVGALELPNGPAFYEHRIRHFTSLNLTAEQVHQTGLSEVARIGAEMEQVKTKAGFNGDLKAFRAFLRTDERFYAKTPEQLMKEVAHVLKKIDGQLPKLFRTLPRMPYGIKPVPDFIAPKTTTAYYQRPAGDGTRAGFYFVNTYDLKSRPLFEVEALSLHEAVPGHHLQIALQQEIPDLPMFRRHEGFTAFVEGWGLYAERLGLETGFYEDPYSDFGRLSYEMWRACRLVVDTGIHAKGWSRQKAIDFMAEHTALSLHNIAMEVDRYISWPGQAVAYKTGELKIRELRALAETRLGAAFDIREFHDVVLLSGAVPLGVLEDQVRRYIDRVLQRGVRP